MTNPLCLYHNDADGACSAWVVRRLHPIAECVSVRYGEPPPLELAAGREVFVVDFSWPVDGLRALADVAASLFVVDHHAPKRDALWDVMTDGDPALPAGLTRFDLRAVDDGLRVVFDSDRSGCGITWDAMFHDDPRPWWVYYVEDRDLWRFALPDSKAVNAYLSTLPFGPEAFDALHSLHAEARNRAPRSVVAMGEAVIAYQDRQVEAICRNARIGTLPGGVQHVPIVNSPALMSEVGHRLAEGAPFAAVWYQQSDGRIKYSLRSVEGGADVATIASAYPGGGGHKHAAGFTCDEVPECVG